MAKQAETKADSVAITITPADPFDNVEWMRTRWNTITTAEQMHKVLSGDVEVKTARDAVSAQLNPVAVKALFSRAVASELKKGPLPKARAWSIKFKGPGSLHRGLKSVDLALIHSMSDIEADQFSAHKQYQLWKDDPNSTFVVLGYDFPRPDAMSLDEFVDHALSSLTVCISVWID